jgi:hypothetical protein
MENTGRRVVDNGKITNLPVESESIIKLAHVKCAALPDELDIARPGASVVE